MKKWCFLITVAIILFSITPRNIKADEPENEGLALAKQKIETNSYITRQEGLTCSAIAILNAAIEQCIINNDDLENKNILIETLYKNLLNSSYNKKSFKQRKIVFFDAIIHSNTGVTATILTADRSNQQILMEWLKEMMSTSEQAVIVYDTKLYSVSGHPMPHYMLLLAVGIEKTGNYLYVLDPLFHDHRYNGIRKRPYRSSSQTLLLLDFNEDIFRQYLGLPAIKMQAQCAH